MPLARRGEIWLVDLGMVQKTRPVVILSVAFLNHERAVATYVPRTTSL
jgi:mRNA-degrading endonuclease toxin of MazEF toxin-antitoxin module